MSAWSNDKRPATRPATPGGVARCMLTLPLAWLAACGSEPKAPDGEGVVPSAFTVRVAGGDGAVDNARDGELTASCATYCAVVMRRCRDSSRQYTSMARCTAACADFPTDGVLGDARGDTLQCRLSFALAARKTTLRSFCRNAGPSGGVACHESSGRPLP